MHSFEGQNLWRIRAGDCDLQGPCIGCECLGVGPVGACCIDARGIEQSAPPARHSRSRCRCPGRPPRNLRSGQSRALPSSAGSAANRPSSRVRLRRGLPAHMSGPRHRCTSPASRERRSHSAGARLRVARTDLQPWVVDHPPDRGSAGPRRCATAPSGAPRSNTPIAASLRPRARCTRSPA